MGPESRARKPTSVFPLTHPLFDRFLAEPEPFFESRSFRPERSPSTRDLKGRSLCPRETGDVKDFHREGGERQRLSRSHRDGGDLGAVEREGLSRAVICPTGGCRQRKPPAKNASPRAPCPVPSTGGPLLLLLTGWRGWCPGRLDDPRVSPGALEYPAVRPLSSAKPHVCGEGIAGMAVSLCSSTCWRGANIAAHATPNLKPNELHLAPPPAPPVREQLHRGSGGAHPRFCCCLNTAATRLVQSADRGSLGCGFNGAET